MTNCRTLHANELVAFWVDISDLRIRIELYIISEREIRATVREAPLSEGH